MTSLLSLIALYYTCDAMATERLLSQLEAAECAAIYRDLKLAFVEGDTDRMSEGYRSFKAWERENPAIVKALRG